MSVCQLKNNLKTKFNLQYHQRFISTNTLSYSRIPSYHGFWDLQSTTSFNASHDKDSHPLTPQLNNSQQPPNNTVTIEAAHIPLIAETTSEKKGPPIPPGPEDCCQSGCVRCVWDIYSEELEKYELENKNNGRETAILKKQEESVQFDPMKAFLEFERTLKHKKQ